jgi:C_GCAxxG_C_C family probable redox protein
MSDPINQACQLFNQGFTCSQSIFCAFAPQLGLQEELALKIASPFGGGIASTGDLCGAVSGAVMVLGLRYGHTTPIEPNSKELTYQKVQEFLRLFLEQHHDTLCRQLRDQKICPKIVEDCAEILTLLLKE